MAMEVKCKLCRKNLFNNKPIQLLTSHSEIKQNLVDIGCGNTNDTDSSSYLPIENVPEWIVNIVNQESWTKGRLYCPHCNNRIGSFNFVNELKCDCGQFITPPIRITNSKVDIKLN
ncbi:E3 ubiquitin-protein ligase RNF180-like isoform X2 [Nomia melanderi]|uniref:E3 ubiquitin-protein ligase RNF180-like isoform X2 n=1 Tax=Nomia melanderi TaxID=2448451 RepID=UPI0013047266|nr:E3 ubiquitin-protein ligase RNF180 isoform X3 [Nomia melanderi]